MIEALELHGHDAGQSIDSGVNRPPSSSTRPRHGLTLLEVIVCIAVIALLVAIALPAIQAVRASARRTQCISNMRQFALAVHSYHADHNVIPPRISRGAFGVHVAVLSHLEMTNEQEFLRSTNQIAKTAEKRRARDSVSMPEVFACPDDGANYQTVHISEGIGSRQHATSYGLNSGTGQMDNPQRHSGFFRLAQSGGFASFSSITRGLSSTAMIAEILTGDSTFARERTIWGTRDAYPPGQLDTLCKACEEQDWLLAMNGTYSNLPVQRGRPWYDGNLLHTGYNHALNPNAPSCTNGTSVELGIFSAGSSHRGGVNVAWGDGRVTFVSTEIDRIVWRSMGDRLAE